MAKRTYNNELNPISYIHSIPFRFLSFRGHSANFRIGNSKQLVFIPSNYVNKNGTIKDNVSLDWWFYKHTNQHKIKLYKEENMVKEEKIKISEIIKLFKEESCNNVIDYEFFKTKCTDNTCFYDLVIYYYTNLYSIEHKEPNELNIVLDNDLRIMGVEFESQGDRMSRTPAWKRLCKAVANDEVFIIDIKEREID